MNIRGHGIPLFSFLLLLIGSLLIVAAAVFWLLPDGPVEPRLPLSVFGPLLLFAGWLSWKYYEPAEKRSVRLAVSIYLFFGIAITAAGLVQRFAPDPDAGVAIAGQKPTNEKQPAGGAGCQREDTKPRPKREALPIAAAANARSCSRTRKRKQKAGAKADKKAEEKNPKKTKEERAAERRAEREKELAEGKAEKEKELRIFTQR